jgi:hypothetical protein
MPPRPLKTKEERLKEGMKILMKLKELGVPQDNCGFQEVKNAISRWVNDGLAVEIKKINFYPFDRYANIILPSISGAEPTFVLKLVPEAALGQ